MDIRKLINNKKIIIVFLIIILFSSCFKEDKAPKVIYNKTETYWYNMIMSHILNRDIERADFYYLTFFNEHRYSKLLERISYILINWHIENKKYILANYYIDLLLKKNDENSKPDYLFFIKIKLDFLLIETVDKEQKLIINFLNKVDRFIIKYPSSNYIYDINTFKLRANMLIYLLNKKISILYDKLGKKESSKFYDKKNSKLPFSLKDIKRHRFSF